MEGLVEDPRISAGLSMLLLPGRRRWSFWFLARIRLQAPYRFND